MGQPLSPLQTPQLSMNLELEVPVPENSGLKTETYKDQFCNIWYDEPLEECEAKFEAVINMEQSGKSVEWDNTYLFVPI